MLTLDREKLTRMPVHLLRTEIDIRSIEDEKLLQEILDSKLQNMPVHDEALPLIIPDIRNGEDEAKWQAVVDGRVEKIRSASVDQSIAREEAELEALQKQIEAEEPIMGSIPLDASYIGGVEFGMGTPYTDEALKEASQVVKSAFCDACTSKGKVHKKDCPKNVK